MEIITINVVALLKQLNGIKMLTFFCSMFFCVVFIHNSRWKNPFLGEILSIIVGENLDNSMWILVWKLERKTVREKDRKRGNKIVAYDIRQLSYLKHSPADVITNILMAPWLSPNSIRHSSWPVELKYKSTIVYITYLLKIYNQY